MLKCDVHEPVQIYIPLASSYTAIWEPLNERGYADYYWTKSDGSERQIERKQWGEVLAGMDKIEDQLRRQMDNHKDVELNLLIEGIAKPDPRGMVIMKETNTGIYVRGRYSPMRMSQVYAWINNVNKYMQVIFTPNQSATIDAIGAFYANDQKDPETHRTFQRHFNKVTFNPNPMVTKLIALGLGSGISEGRAIALIERFSTVWNVCSASPRELAETPGIGIETAKKFLMAVGRPDVV